MLINEEVMVVDKTSLVDKFNLQNGVITGKVKDDVYEFVLANHFYMARQEAETSDLHKQIIPYVVVTFEGKYLLFKRKSKQSETRLHNMYSLGVGGHINPDTQNENDPIIAGLFKEFYEELTLAEHTKPRFIGLVNDDSNMVGECHLGFLFTLEALTYQFSLPEFDKMEADWVDKKKLAELYEYMESWSKFYYDRFVSDGRPYS